VPRTAKTIVERIKRFNQGRSPRLLAMKYATMRVDAFSFYRGTCHLFYEDLPRSLLLDRSPLAWICGDLHPENFGSYRGRDGRVYFDVNDFDEAALAPSVWDVIRCLCGILVGTRVLGILDEDGLDLSRRFLYAYCACLADGVPQALDQDTATGMVHDLLTGVQSRSADELARKRSTGSGTKRRIAVDGVHALPLKKSTRNHVAGLFEEWTQSKRRANRYQLIDVAERIAGTGSKGVPRYVLLVARRRLLRLLDLKMEPRSSPAPYVRVRQPKWRSEAERVVTAQKCAQASPPWPLTHLTDGEESYVLRELQPTEDRVRWEKWHGKLERLEHLMSSMGQVAAWGHLRSAHFRGAAPLKDLAAFGRDGGWRQRAASYARDYAASVARDYSLFCRAYDRGQFRLSPRKA
jgi:uncharacterized protein (DUF2252 family)